MIPDEVEELLSLLEDAVLSLDAVSPFEAVLSLDEVLLLVAVLLFDDAELLLPDAAAVVSSVSGGNVVSGISSHMHFFSHLQSLLISFSLVSLVLLDDVLFEEVLLFVAELSADLFLLQASVLQSWVSTFSVHSSPPLVLVRVLFCCPPPHVSVQVPQSVHSSHSQVSNNICNCLPLSFLILLN